MRPERAAEGAPGWGAADGAGADGGEYEDCTTLKRYATTAGERRHVALRDVQVVGVAAAAVLGVWARDPGIGLILGSACGAATVGGRRREGSVVLVVLLGGCLGLAGGGRGLQAWHDLTPDELGPYSGWMRIVDDPQPYVSSVRVIVEIEGERFETWSRGRARSLRVREWRAGEWVAVSGQRVALDAERAQRVAWQHVVGEFEVDWASDVRAGDEIARASNRVRAAIERAADQLPDADGALFRGLVVGDDRDQPRAMIERFRASGLSHLTAVSGQNVAFVLAACGPLLRRLRPWTRWAVTLALIAWFVSLTRFEPSIVRAGVMAGLAATAFVTGHERAPVRVLALAVCGLVVVDPLLVWSVGFWLSVGATAGVSGIGPWLAERLRRLGVFALPVAVTLGAQIGVVIPSVLVFGRLPLVSVPANLLAVPVAGAVMLYGMPAGLVAGWCSPIAGVVMWPARLGTRWVDTVAVLGARFEPDPPMQYWGWGVVAILVTVVVAADVRRRGSEAAE